MKPTIEFSNKEEAKAFINKLRSAGINAYVVRHSNAFHLIIK